MTETQKLQFEMLKAGKIGEFQIEAKDMTDEMKWWCIENNRNLRGFPLTAEMVQAMIRKGNRRFDEEYISTSNISEDDWLEGIKNSSLNVFLIKDSLVGDMLSNKVKITPQIAMAICLKCPFLYNMKEISMYVPEDRKQEISDVFFSKAGEWHFELPETLPISEEQWEWILNSRYLHRQSGYVETYISKRNDVPQYIRNDALTYAKNIYKIGDIKKEDLLFWLDANKDNLGSKEYKEMLEYIESNINSDILQEIMQEQGWFIEHVKKQSKELCIAAIKCNPHNIKHIKKASNELMLLALSLDKTVEKHLKKTKAVCQALGIKYEAPKKVNPYPAENYLIMFDENLADEGNLIKVCVVKGKDMEKFLDKKVSLSFGNLDDDEERPIKEIASYQPITEEELAVLEKFGLDDLMSGYFSIS